MDIPIRCDSVSPSAGSLPRPSDDRAALSALEGIVAAAFRLPGDALGRASRGEARVAFARQVAMYVAHVWLGMSMTEVGRRFGRDRTTVAHGCRVVEDRREDPRVDRLVDCIEAAVESWRGAGHRRTGDGA